MLWAIAESGKLEKKKVWRNLVRARSLEGLGTLARRVYCCSCILATFSSGFLTAWSAAERFYAEGFGFLFDNTSSVVLVFASLFPLSLPFNYCCGCDYLWFRLFINSVLAYVHVSHIYCLIISLN